MSRRKNIGPSAFGQRAGPEHELTDPLQHNRPPKASASERRARAADSKTRRALEREAGAVDLSRVDANDFPTRARLTLERARKQSEKKTRYRFNGKHPGEHALKRLRTHAPIEAVLAEFFGNCMEGLRWQAKIGEGCERGHFERGCMAEAAIRSLDHPCARHYAIASVYFLSRLIRHGRKLSVIGSEAFLGKTRRVRMPSELAELERQREAEESARGFQSAKPISAVEYVPVWQAGGASARIGVGPRQLWNYAQVMLATEVLHMWQPDPEKADDAVFPLDGQYPYPEWSLLPGNELPNKLMAALLAWWRDRADDQRERPRAPTHKFRTPWPSPTSARGPPESPAGVAAAE